MTSGVSLRKDADGNVYLRSHCKEPVYFLFDQRKLEQFKEVCPVAPLPVHAH